MFRTRTSIAVLLSISLVGMLGATAADPPVDEGVGAGNPVAGLCGVLVLVDEPVAAGETDGLGGR